MVNNKFSNNFFNSFIFLLKKIIKKISFPVMFSNINNFFISFELFDKFIPIARNHDKQNSQYNNNLYV